MKSRFKDIPLSVLDLAVINQGNTARDALHRSLDLARHTEQLGFHRFWVAEHHNMPSIASSATTVLMGYIAGHTQRIRVGSGGIMLPNHPPLVVAEQIGTLESLYPGRIDLGLGRAPGTDGLTAYALRRSEQSVFHFPDEVRELQQYFSAANHTSRVRAIPGEGLDIPIWILGSSTDSARLAAALGLPYSFASHFAPRQLHEAREMYVTNFRPSAQLDQPYFMPCVNVIAADTDREAEILSTSVQKLFTGIITGSRAPLQPPEENYVMDPRAAAALPMMLEYSFIGSPATVKERLEEFVGLTGADELMVVSHIYDGEARDRSFEILKTVQQAEQKA